MFEAVLLQLLLMFEGFDAASALIWPFKSVSPQVIFESCKLQEDTIAVWTSGFSSVVDLHVSLIMRQFHEVFLAQRTVILIMLVTLLMFLQSIFHFELLPTDAAGKGFLMN